MLLIAVFLLHSVSAETSGLVDAPFPSPAKPDVGVRSKASSLANTISSIRAGAEAVKQTSLRTGTLVTTSMMSTLSDRCVNDLGPHDCTCGTGIAAVCVCAFVAAPLEATSLPHSPRT